MVMALKFVVLDWTDVVRLSINLCNKIRASGFNPDCIVTLLRGGLVPARIISDCLNIPQVYTMGVAFYEDVGKHSMKPIITQPLEVDLKGKKILLVDDVVDTGKSIVVAIENLKEKQPHLIKVAVLHKKPWSEIDPDFYVEESDAWIVYPWEFYETLLSLDRRLRSDAPRKEKAVIEKTLESIKKILSMYS